MTSRQYYKIDTFAPYVSGHREGPQSRGKRDDVANNGESLEVALIPGNRGTLIARDVWLELTSPTAGVVVKPTLIQVGDLRRSPKVSSIAFR